MADPTLEWTDNADVPLAASVHDFGKVAPGTAATLETWRVHNDRLAVGGIPTASNLQLIVEAHLEGDTIFLGEGVPMLDARAFRVRPTVENGLAVSRPFFNLGSGVQLALPDLDPETFHEFEVEPLPPATISQTTTEFRLVIADQQVTQIGDAFASAPGIFRGVGRGQVTGVLDRDGAFGVTGIGTLEQPQYSFYFDGEPHSELAVDVTIDDLDGAAAALVVTESYIFYRILTTTGTATLKGLKAVGPTFPADAPALSDGEVALGWGERDFAADLTFAELSGAVPDFFKTRIDSGTTATVGSSGGPMIVEGAKIETTTESLVPLTDDAVNTIWMLRDGTFAVTTDGSSPQLGAQDIGRHTLVAGVETLAEDLRRWADESREVEKVLGGDDGDVTAWRNVSTRSLWIRPDGISLFIPVLPSSFTPTPTSGRLEVDILILEPGGTINSIFPSAEFPGYEWDATERVEVAVPEDPLEIPKGSTLVFVVANTLAPSASPDWLDIAVVVDYG